MYDRKSTLARSKEKDRTDVSIETNTAPGRGIDTALVLDCSIDELGRTF